MTGLRVDILTPAADSSYAALAAGEVEDYRALFAGAGTALEPRSWTDGPGEADVTLALLAWGYHMDVARWDALLAGWPADRPLLNAPALMAWNTRKTYLSDLEQAGVPVVPTLFATADDAAVAVAFDRFGCDELVVKPAISAGSFRTERVRPGRCIAPLADAMIQPFLPAVRGEGELSLFYIGGELTHAIRKVAAPGDFRVQPQFGGANSRWTPDADALAVTEAALAAAPAPPLYVRIDLIRLPDGRLALMELEAIEPDLYLDYGDNVGERLVRAVINNPATPAR